MRTIGILLLLGSLSFADTISLRDGRIVHGSFIGGDTRSVRIAVGDRVENYSISDISTISFDNAGPSASSSSSNSAASSRAAENTRRGQPATAPSPVLRADDARSARRVIPSGAVLTVRMIDDVDSERDTVGKTYRASLDEPLNDADGNTLVQRGADVTVKLVDDKQSGKIEGRTVLTLDIVSLMVDGKAVDVDTAVVTQESASRTARSGKVIGGTAAVGAIIGAIAGGGKGAAIGAASGAGVGTAAQVMTKGQRVKIPSETRLSFTLQQAVRL